MAAKIDVVIQNVRLPVAKLAASNYNNTGSAA